MKVTAQTETCLHPCVFFDRDGIINAPPPPEDRYILHPDRFRIIPGFLQALRITQAKGYRAIVITNQKCISRGLLSRDELDAIHERMHQLIHAAGLELTAVYFCPHGEDDHPNRKPNPGMLLQAAGDHDIDLQQSWMIGDNEKDIAAGQTAGCCCTVRVAPDKVNTKADFHIHSMSELPPLLEKNLPVSRS
jgi:histidinol-phosphate phosphatase family protein